MNRIVTLLIFLIWPLFLLSQNPDIQLLRAFNSPESLPSDNFFRFVSNSDYYIVAGTPVILAVTGFIKDDREMILNSVVMIAGEALNNGLKLALKYSVNRNRPYVTYPDIIAKTSVSSPSFPSGHTSSAFANATSLSLAYPEWYIIVPSYAWATAVGYSRMHLGVHYPSDVIAGALVGAGSAYLTFKINQKLNHRKVIKP